MLFSSFAVSFDLTSLVAAADTAAADIAAADIAAAAAVAAAAAAELP